MDINYVKIIVTVSLAVIGWMIGHYFTTKRDLNNKKREIVIHHLIDAYRVLIDEVAHREESIDRNRKLEKLIADIQLFGSDEQIQLARALADDVSKGSSFE